MGTGDSLAMLPWFVRDYIAATRQFSLAERGAYTDLLFLSWEIGPLPKDLARLARLIGCDRTEFASVWPVIRDKFTETAEGLVNIRLEEHRAESMQRSESARASANARWKKYHRNANASASADANAYANGDASAHPNASANASERAYANGHAKSMLPSPSPSPSPNPYPSPSPKIQNPAPVSSSVGAAAPHETVTDPPTDLHNPRARRRAEDAAAELARQKAIPRERTAEELAEIERKRRQAAELVERQSLKERQT